MHLEALKSNQKQVLEKLKYFSEFYFGGENTPPQGAGMKAAERTCPVRDGIPRRLRRGGVHLAGGTALALQIGHRISVDFDLFSPKEISKGLLDKVKRIFKECKLKTIINHSGQLSVEINGIKIDFAKYTFPLTSKPIKLQGINILKASEIAAMKAYALNRRGTLKDYVDLYFILKDKHTTIKDIKKIAEKKYEDEFNFRLFLEQLVYLEDIEEEKIEFLKEKITKNQLQRFFEDEVNKIKL